MNTDRLDGVLAALNLHQQRATYSAVAGLIGMTPRSLMRGKPRGHANSWIVSKNAGTPTGYAEAETHPQLMENATILDSPEALQAWLAERGDSRRG